MKRPLDTKKIWELLKSDPTFTKGAPDGALEVFHEVIEALPKILAKRQLKALVTLSTLTKAKLDIVEHMLDTGIVIKIAATIPEELRTCSPEELADFIKSSFEQLRTPFMEMIHNTKSFLADYGVTEYQVLADPKGCNLNQASLNAYRAGKLTIRRLLETQPATLLATGQ